MERLCNLYQPTPRASRKITMIAPRKSSLITNDPGDLPTPPFASEPNIQRPVPLSLSVILIL